MHYFSTLSRGWHLCITHSNSIALWLLPFVSFRHIRMSISLLIGFRAVIIAIRFGLIVVNIVRLRYWVSVRAEKRQVEYNTVRNQNSVATANVHIPVNVVTYMLLAFLEDDSISFETFSVTVFVGTIESLTIRTGFLMGDRPPISCFTSR